MLLTLPLIKNDVVTFGILALVLALIFWSSTSKNKHLQKFYSIIPVLLLCYFVPGILNSTGLISGADSHLYDMGSQYLLPGSLVLFTLGLDLKEIWKLRKKAGLMFITGSVGIIIGGPIALYLVSLFYPSVLGGAGSEETWRGLSAIAGSWIGGSANQTAMYAIFQPSSDLFSAMIAVDVIIANIWLAFLLYGTGIHQKIDRFLKADSSAIDHLKEVMSKKREKGLRLPTTAHTIIVVGTAFAIVGISQFFADYIADTIQAKAPFLEKFSLTSSFLWLVILSTTFGVILSLTKARKLEGYGASRLGSVLLYFLIAIIGMNMNILAIFEHPTLFLVGLIWIIIHAALLFAVARLAKAPFFFLAVGSQANIGGAASAPIVAGAFNPALAPVGVLLAIFGYVIGTYGAYLCSILMSLI